ncbi:DoxX family protein [Streptomyces sp. NPDC002680]|uniref:DoxX family protein n=1 Tax=Streptomyces sp. NPDC002680 TaxID=3364659 RepID=UPI0036CCC91F
MSTFAGVLSVILALTFLGSGVAKLVGVPAVEESGRLLRISHRLHLTVALLEIAAVAGLVIGLWWRPLQIAAAVGLTLLMVGAVAYHVRADDSAQNTSVPAVLGLLTLTTTMASLMA